MLPVDHRPAGRYFQVPAARRPFRLDVGHRRACQLASASHAEPCNTTSLRTSQYHAADYRAMTCS